MKKRLLFIFILMVVMIVGTACGEPAEPAGQNGSDIPAVEIESLLNRQGSFELVLFTSVVDVDGRMAVYENIPEGVSDRLAKALGEPFGSNGQWYRVAGHENIYYLIKCHEGNYSLWKFGAFLEEEYLYTDVLATIYGIHSAEDIAEIIVSPANMDNTPAGQQLQAEIGTFAITDEKAIGEIYDIVSGLTCYGENNWELIDMGDSSEEGMLNRVRQGRYLTFITPDGLKIDELKYTAASGTFYEYGGIAYNPLTAKEKEKVDEILGIE